MTAFALAGGIVLGAELQAGEFVGGIVAGMHGLGNHFGIFGGTNGIGQILADLVGYGSHPFLGIGSFGDQIPLFSTQQI